MADCPECGGSGWVSPNYRRGACCDCEPLSDLLQEHGVDGLKQLAEAGAKLPEILDEIETDNRDSLLECSDPNSFGAGSCDGAICAVGVIREELKALNKEKGE